MRFSFRFFIVLIPCLVVAAFAFLSVMNGLERKWISEDLNHRALVIARQVEPNIISALVSPDRQALPTLLNQISADAALWGMIVCSMEGQRVAKSQRLPEVVGCADNRTELGRWDGIFSGERYHRVEFPLISEGKKIGRLGVYYSLNLSPGSFDRYATQRYTILALLAFVFFVSIVVIFVHRWSVSRSFDQFSLALKGVVKGDITKVSKLFENTDFAPLVKNLDRVLKDLRRTKQAALSEPTSAWTASRLRDEVKRLFGDARLCVIANREPYIHNRKGKKIEVVNPASGLVTAVEPILRACAGLWIGHGSGSADRETADKRGVLLVPPGHPEYALKRVWLTRQEEEGYYYGFSNEGLWPLCHIAHTRPLFRSEDWKVYKTVNEKFASAFQEEMKTANPIALIQDYHFALLPGILRQKRPDAVTSLFWHIPWPSPEFIHICPWKNELIEGMLGADLIGFHVQYHCNNFLDTVDRFLEARVDRENFSVTIRGHTCYIKPFPVSVEWPSKHQLAPEQFAQNRAELLEELSLPNDTILGLGVDRLDYTKGIVERLLAVEKMLERHPELVGKFVFIQIAAPSRTHIKRYKELETEVREHADRINFRFHRDNYEPIVLKIEHHSSGEVFRFYRAANVCIVTSLHDGMNLVAKEYIASREDGEGALVLSSFTGAGREIKDALIVNPYDIEETADAIFHGLTMSDEERRGRMKRMRELVSSHNVYSWAAEFLAEIHAISEHKNPRLGTAI